MNKTIFVPFLDLGQSPHLSCANDLRVPNHLKNYKLLAFSPATEVVTYQITPEDNKDRGLIFQAMRNIDSVIREYVSPQKHSYVLEVLIDAEYSATFSTYLEENNISYQIP